MEGLKDLEEAMNWWTWRSAGDSERRPRPWSADAKGNAWRQMEGVAGREREARRHRVDMRVTVMPRQSS